jgi:hypothetical protein
VKLSSIGVVALCASLLAGCFSLQAYDGPRQPKAELAHVSGDPRLRSGVPVSVFLRKVDDRDLDPRYRAVDVIPGKHTLLVDCQIAETRNVTRFPLEMYLEPGTRYALEAETGPGNRTCENVRVKVLD